MINEELFRAALEVRILLMSLFRLATRALQQRPQLAQEGLSGLQYGMLCALSREESTLSDLSHRLMADPSTLVPVVDALERKGMLERHRDPADRRRVPLTLTERGRALVAAVPPVDEHDLLVVSLRGMGEADARQFVRLLRELVRHMPEGAELLRQASERAQLWQMPPRE